MALISIRLQEEAQTTDIHTAFGGNRGLRHQQDLGCSRTTDLDMTLGGSIDCGHGHDLRWKGRPLTSTRPLAAEQPTGINTDSGDNTDHRHLQGFGVNVGHR